jgi:hypothetical protein
MGNAHACDVAGVTGAVTAAVQVADGRGGVGHRADEEQVVIWPVILAATASAAGMSYTARALCAIQIG